MARIEELMAAVPEPHRTFLAGALEQLARDSRLVGVAAGGSFLTGEMDEYSDLDLVVAVEPEAFEEVMAERRGIAQSLGPLLEAFTGEHVGEPRVLICLYGPPPLHVDLKFVALPDAAERVEDPAVLWERDGRLSEVLTTGEARYPQPDPQWIEDRFWIWIHYGAAKIGRGELFEALDFLAFLRFQALGPLALASRGATPTGVRKLESEAPDLAAELRRTIAAYDARSLVGALRAAADLYVRLRNDAENGPVPNHRAEREALDYLTEIESRLDTA